MLVDQKRVIWRRVYCQLLIIWWSWRGHWLSLCPHCVHQHSHHSLATLLHQRHFLSLLIFMKASGVTFHLFSSSQQGLSPRELRRKALSCCHLCNYQLWTRWQFVVVVDFLCYANVPAHSLSAFFPPHSIKRNITHLISCCHLFPSEISSSHILVFFRLVGAKQWHFEFWLCQFYLLFIIKGYCQ